MTYSLFFHADDDAAGYKVFERNCYSYVGHMMSKMTDYG